MRITPALPGFGWCFVDAANKPGRAMPDFNAGRRLPTLAYPLSGTVIPVNAQPETPAPIGLTRRERLGP